MRLPDWVEQQRRFFHPSSFSLGYFRARMSMSPQRKTWLTLLVRGNTPGKTGLTSQSKGMSWLLMTYCARRAGCIERCLSGSTEARRSNPSRAKWISWRVIPTFYPMDFFPNPPLLELVLAMRGLPGRRRNTLLERCCQAS